MGKMNPTCTAPRLRLARVVLALRGLLLLLAAQLLHYLLLSLRSVAVQVAREESKV